MRIALALGRGPGTPMTRANAQLAAQLLKKLEVDMIVVFGRWSVREPDGKFTETEAAGMTWVLTQCGVSPDHFLIEDWSRDTAANMVGTLQVLNEVIQKPCELVIAALPYTGLRARFLARKVFGPHILVR